MCIRDRIETSGADVTIDIAGGAVGEVINVDWGDGVTETFTRAAVTAETLTHTFVGTAASHTVEIFSTSDVAWTSVESNGVQTVDSLSTCYVREYVESVNNSLVSAVRVDYSDYRSLTTLVVSGPNLADIDITNTCVTSLTATGSALSQTAVNEILSQLVNCGANGGTVNLSGGTSSPPSPGNLDVATLTARGWTVTTN